MREGMAATAPNVWDYASVNSLQGRPARGSGLASDGQAVIRGLPMPDIAFRSACFDTSPEKRPILRRIGIVRFAETGWWCAQFICEPVSPGFRLRSGNFLQNSANNRLLAG
jgi:hypothetical protein